ncbi:MAG: hypothetical protein V4671_00360 [Armatimonadota bacterium]
MATKRVTHVTPWITTAGTLLIGIGLMTLHIKSGQAQSGQTENVKRFEDRSTLETYASPTKGPVALEGRSLLAFNVAYKALLDTKDIAPDKKNLRNYSVIFNEDDTSQYLHFVPKSDITMNKDGTVSLVRDSERYGREVRFTVSRKTLKVTGVKFFH